MDQEPEIPHTFLHENSSSLMESRFRYAQQLLDSLPGIPEDSSLLFRAPHGNITHVYPLKEGQLVSVGRKAPSTIQLPDCEKLSGVHFSILMSSGDAILFDPAEGQRASTNGTYRNDSDQRIAKCKLHDGDLIYAGGIIFVYCEQLPQF